MDMEVALEFEDDLFFADLSRQLSLLLMDDNDQDPVPPQTHVSFSLQALSNGIHQQSSGPLLVNEKALTGGSMSKGTGVFIPRSLQPTRKQRRGRYTLKPNRQFPLTIDVNSQLSSNHSFPPKRS